MQPPSSFARSHLSKFLEQPWPDERSPPSHDRMAPTLRKPPRGIIVCQYVTISYSQCGSALQRVSMSPFPTP
eukprot:221125-Pelagomonas_calceolata.AAC.3